MVHKAEIIINSVFDKLSKNKKRNTRLNLDKDKIIVFDPLTKQFIVGNNPKNSQENYKKFN